MHNAGYKMSDAAKLSQQLIGSQINREAFIKGVNDDFMIAAVITLLGIIPVIWLRTKKVKDKSLLDGQPDTRYYRST